MNAETIRQSLELLRISQVSLARAAGLSEATISRQLSGDLRLTEHVRRHAAALINRRAAEMTAHIRDWAERRGYVAQENEEA